MKHLFTALALLLSVSPTLAASIDTGNLTPTLTYPKPAPNRTLLISSIAAAQLLWNRHSLLAQSKVTDRREGPQG